MKIYLLSTDDLYTGIFMDYPGTVAPYNATDVKPMDYQEGHVRKFDRVTKTWSQVVYVAPADTRSLPEAKAQKFIYIDQDTSSKIIAGFKYTYKDVPYHFSYDTFDQQNFADTANVATLVMSNADPDANLPTSVTWNAYTIPVKNPELPDEEQPKPELTRLVLHPAEFLKLYTEGALGHKGLQMELGGARKAAVVAATTLAEVDAA